MIPRRLIRTVPAETTNETEQLWDIAVELHPSWEHVTLRDPIDRTRFPITSPYWDECETGAQLADLVRIEELYLRGGVYIDSDVLALKPFDDLTGLYGFAAWEDTKYTPNAVMGFAAGHPSANEVIAKAVDRQKLGTWEAGVGVTTEVFTAPGSQVTLLPPQSFYPVDWRTAHNTKVDWSKVAADNPWAYCLHMYKGSWVK